MRADELRALQGELARTRHDLAVSEERFRAAFHHGPMAMCALGDRGEVVRVNPALRRLLSLPSDRLLGEPLAALVAPPDRERLAVAVAAAGGVDGPAEPVEVRLQRAGGGRVWCEVGVVCVADGVVQALVSLVEVERRKVHEARLDGLAASDDLTGLANSAALEVVLAELLAPQEAYGPLTLLRVDLEGVREASEGPGHEAGDTVLVELASRLRGTVRPQDVVARVGPERFVVVCHDLDGPDARGVRSLVRRLHRGLSAPVLLLDGSRTVRATLAVVRATPGEHAGTVLARLEAAGQNPQPLVTRQTRRAPAVEGPARLVELDSTAVAEDRLVALYQPVVDLRTGAVLGAEALLRMYDREGRLVMPDTFIPLAEASGAIHALGDWVLTTACRQGARWKQALPSGAEFGVGVNLSPRQLDDPYLLGRVEAALEDSGLEPACLVLELTERLLTTDTPQVRAQLAALRRYGVHLAADDFGTGYCSVRYLLDLPLDIIKIDRSWTARLGDDSPSGRLADGVARLACSSGLLTIVEGIETESERSAALAHGLRLGQGYLFAEPLSAADLESRLFAG